MHRSCIAWGTNATHHKWLMNASSWKMAEAPRCVLIGTYSPVKRFLRVNEHNEGGRAGTRSIAMKSKLLITVAAAAAIAGIGLANAQEEKGHGNAPAAHGAPSAPHAQGGPSGAMGSPHAQAPSQGPAQHMENRAQQQAPNREENRAQQQNREPNREMGQTEQRGKSDRLNAERDRGERNQPTAQEERNQREHNQPAAQNERGRMDQNRAQREEGNRMQRQGTAQGNSERGANVRLSSEQRTRIHETIIGEQGAPRIARNDLGFNLSVGVRVPHDRIHFVPLPETIVEIEPEWRGYDYFLVGDEVVVVDPDTFEVVAVIPA
jgi:hypothetical protein